MTFGVPYPRDYVIPLHTSPMLNLAHVRDASNEVHERCAHAVRALGHTGR